MDYFDYENGPRRVSSKKSNRTSSKKRTLRTSSKTSRKSKKSRVLNDSDPGTDQKSIKEPENVNDEAEELGEVR